MAAVQVDVDGIRRSTVRTDDGIELAGSAWSADHPHPLPDGLRALTFVWRTGSPIR
jgi:hypothetical protein